MIRKRVQLASPPPAVYETLATDEGRARFWADSAVEAGGVIDFRFSNGMRVTGAVLERRPPERFSVSYFDGSRVDFDLEPDDVGGTIVTVTETGYDESCRESQAAGWVSVLLTLKAAVDFGVDLRNSSPEHDWGRGFVDV